MTILRKENNIMYNMKSVERRAVELGIIPKSSEVAWDDESQMGGAYTTIFKGTVEYLDGSTSRLEAEVDCRDGRIWYLGKCR